MKLMVLFLCVGQVEPRYDRAHAEALKSGKPMVVGVGCAAPAGKWVTTYAKGLDGYAAPCVVLGVPDGDSLTWVRTFPATARQADIDLALTVHRSRLGVSQAAAPFADDAPPQAADDSGPWLSRAETDRIKALWPSTLPFPIGLKFYRLAPRYQRLTTMNNGATKVRQILPLHDEHHPFVVSGGLDTVDASTWTSTKGLDIPAGAKIKVWQERTDVRAYDLVPRWRWRFPVGTVAYDVLSTPRGVFELRTQERTEDGWRTEILHKDLTFAPAGYNGLKVSCNACHAQAGNVVDVPGEIYRRVRWGDDGRYSWRPFREDGTLDKRWPLEE